jgi:putative PIG3 family NAD(P)H quinone oxidoreductase
MHAITIAQPGGPEVLTWTEVPDLEPGFGEVLIDVEASAVNRADLMQRQGFYPPPPGASEYPGMECSGRIAALGQGVKGWKVGDEVCALLAGGGYAEQVVAPATQLLPIPKGISVVEAAALPEVFCTVWSNVFALARLAPGDAFLVHGGAGGIGTAAIQLAAAYGARVFTTASANKHERCRALGAERAIDYRSQDFVEVVREATEGRGVDVILDNMGAKYLDRNVDALAPNGRLVIIGMQGGVKGDLNIGKLLGKRAGVIATALRSRPVEGPASKTEICTQVVANVWPMIAGGQVRPIIGAEFPIQEARAAHELLSSGEVAGKIVLRISD